MPILARTIELPISPTLLGSKSYFNSSWMRTGKTARAMKLLGAESHIVHLAGHLLEM
jgi:hypothetical protein